MRLCSKAHTHTHTHTQTTYADTLVSHTQTTYADTLVSHTHRPTYHSRAHLLFLLSLLYGKICVRQAFFCEDCVVSCMSVNNQRAGTMMDG